MDKKVTIFLSGIALLLILIVIPRSCSSENSSTDNLNWYEISKDKTIYLTLPGGSDQYEPELIRNGVGNLVIETNGKDYLWVPGGKPLAGIYYERVGIRIPDSSKIESGKIKLGYIKKQKKW